MVLGDLIFAQGPKQLSLLILVSHWFLLVLLLLLGVFLFFNFFLMDIHMAWVLATILLRFGNIIHHCLSWEKICTKFQATWYLFHAGYALKTKTITIKKKNNKLFPPHPLHLPKLKTKHEKSCKSPCVSSNFYTYWARERSHCWIQSWAKDICIFSSALHLKLNKSPSLFCALLRGTSRILDFHMMVFLLVWHRWTNI